MTEFGLNAIKIELPTEWLVGLEHAAAKDARSLSNFLLVSALLRARSGSEKPASAEVETGMSSVRVFPDNGSLSEIGRAASLEGRSVPEYLILAGTLRAEGDFGVSFKAQGEGAEREGDRVGRPESGITR